MNRRAFISGTAATVLTLSAGLSEGGIFGKSIRIKWTGDISGLPLSGDSVFRELSSAGLQGFMCGQNLFELFQNRPGELKNLLHGFGLKQWIFHAGTMPFDGTDKPETMKYMERMLAFAGNAGAAFVLFSAEKRDSYPPGKAKLAKLALALDAMAETAGKNKMKLLIGHAMHSICQTSEELEFVYSQCKSRHKGIYLDLAMMTQSGTQPEHCILSWGKKITAIRFNDITRPVKGFAGSNDRNYRLEIPGKGNSVNFSGVLAALKKNRFRGVGICVRSAADDTAPASQLREGLGWLKKNGF